MRPERVSGSEKSDTQSSILFVITSSDFGGTEESLRQLVLRLDQRVFNTTVCSLRPLGRIGKVLADTGTEIVSLEMSEKPRIAETIRAVRQLIEIIDRLDIHLVQSLLYRANATVALASQFSRTRPIVVAGQRSLGPMRGRVPHWMARWSHRAAARIVAVSEAVKQELIEGSGQLPSKIEVIGNGVDTERFQPGDRDSLRRELGVESNQILVGSVGRLSEKKGQNYLVDALNLALSRRAPLKLVIVGDGPTETALKDQIARLGMQDEVVFLGFRSDLDRIYPALDIFVLPSLEEGSPNALLEAMACECAPIASAVGGVPEIIDDRVSGLLVPPGLPEPLAEALVELANASDERLRLQKAARERVKNQFDLSLTVDRYQNLYLSLLEGSDPESLPRP